MFLKVSAMESTSSVSSRLNTGVEGIKSGLESMRQNADQVAKANSSNEITDVVKPMVNMIADRTQIEASVKVVQAEDAMTKTIGSLLDVTA